MHAFHPLSGAPIKNPDYPLDPGWEFFRWLSETSNHIRNGKNPARFTGEASVHRAYDRGGIPAALERCAIGRDAALNLALADDSNSLPVGRHMDYFMGWVNMINALLDLRDDYKDHK